MIKKYKKITFILLTIIPLIFCLFFADVWILPQKKFRDTIISYSETTIAQKSKFSNSKNKRTTFYKFYTQGGYHFCTGKNFVGENEVVIENSYLFKIVTAVKSESEDYSDDLVFGSNSLILYLITGLLTSAIGSLLMLRYYKNLSENGFQNIICLNSLLIIILLYFLRFQN